MAKSTTPARDAVLVKYLNEAYGKETQLETALKAQIALAQRTTLKKGLQEHLKVTKAQARGLKKRIRELGGKADANPDVVGPDVVADAAGAVSAAANKAVAAAKAPVQALRGTSEADNELRNIRDCLWNEAEEIAHYNVIEAAAEELGDKETVKLARQYRREEERMQALLNREIPKVIKSVVRDEVPKEERPAPRRTRSSSSSRRSASASRSTGSGRSAGRSTTAAKKSPSAAKRSTAAATKSTTSKRSSASSARRSSASKKA